MDNETIFQSQFRQSHIEVIILQFIAIFVEKLVAKCYKFVEVIWWILWIELKSAY
jgi:hypothetical protein